MTRSTSLTPACLAAALALAAGFAASAHASPMAAASADFHNLSFSFIDLDLGDGVTPAVFGIDGMATATTAGYDRHLMLSTVTITDHADDLAAGLAGPAQSTLISGSTELSASSGANAMSARASTTGSSVNVLENFSARVDSKLLFGALMLTLAPNSVLVLSGDLALSVFTDQCFSTRWGESCQEAYGGAQLKLFAPDASGGLGQQSSIARLDHSLLGSGSGPITFDSVQHLQVSLTNLTDQPLQFSFEANVWAGGRSALAVPEPQTYALMLAGLAGIAGLRRARDRRAAAPGSLA
ncbi:PEP-CTERM sorting domain-containing protein [Ideonella sp. BN130291]|uniref:PEP-CTERM sorting domain-containing protein n=1 Tax=Ideonella sp. BN130291 TaxID=3112940 RepID=UPI002E2770AC|nr:PEP-CTERM sorting domain-containing protein [Ideonella sp. BN130291]